MCQSYPKHLQIVMFGLVNSCCSTVSTLRDRVHGCSFAMGLFRVCPDVDFQSVALFCFLLSMICCNCAQNACMCVWL